MYSSTYCCVFVLYAVKLVGNELMSCCINGAAAAEDEDYKRHWDQDELQKRQIVCNDNASDDEAVAAEDG